MASKAKKPLIFSTASYNYLRKELVASGKFASGKLKREFFPDGELYNRVDDKVDGRDAILLGGTINDADTLELFDLGCAIVQSGARRLTVVIPYYGYSTMERAVKSGEVVKAKTRAMLFSAIPRATEGNRFVLMDLHSEGIPHYFENGVTTFHVYCKKVIAKLCQKLVGKKEFVLGSTDSGRAKWVESLASDMGVSAGIILKHRISATETEVTGISCDVEGKTVVIYDDMIRTGGTAKRAAEAYRAHGAKKVFLIATHGVFPGDALITMLDSGLFDGIACTDTHPRAVQLKSEKQFKGKKFQVVAVADLLGKQLMKGVLI